MTIFEIINLLESTSGLPVTACATSTELVIRFTKPMGRTVKQVFTDEEIRNSDTVYWAAIGGAIKLKYKSER